MPLLISSCALPSHTSVPWDRPGNLQQVGKAFRACTRSSICRTKGVPISGMDEGAGLGNRSPPRSRQAASGEVKELVYLSGRDMVTSRDRDPGVFLKVLVDGRDDRVPRLSSLRMVSWMEWKSKWVVMTSRIGVVRRVLDRGEILDLVLGRDDDHAAGMLPGRPLDPGRSLWPGGAPPPCEGPVPLLGRYR